MATYNLTFFCGTEPVDRHRRYPSTPILPVTGDVVVIANERYHVLSREIEYGPLEKTFEFSDREWQHNIIIQLEKQ